MSAPKSRLTNSELMRKLLRLWSKQNANSIRVMQRTSSKSRTYCSQRSDTWSNSVRHVKPWTKATRMQWLRSLSLWWMRQELKTQFSLVMSTQCWSSTSAQSKIHSKHTNTTKRWRGRRSKCSNIWMLRWSKTCTDHLECHLPTNRRGQPPTTWMKIWLRRTYLKTSERQPIFSWRYL